MKTLKFLFFATIIVASGVLGYISYQKNQKPALSELAMANVEALTSEGEAVIIECGRYSGKCWKFSKKDYDERGNYITYCSYTGYTINYCDSTTPY